MDENLLRTLIRMMVSEVRGQPRVGDQLKKPNGSPESGDEEDDADTEEKVAEFSGAGAVAGMTLPLGMKTPGKKKKPGWR